MAEALHSLHDRALEITSAGRTLITLDLWVGASGGPLALTVLQSLRPLAWREVSYQGGRLTSVQARTE